MSTVEAKPPILVTALPPTNPSEVTPAHWVGNPPTGFQNPWPSFAKHSGWEMLQTRFSKDRNLVPVPPRDELVAIRSPDFGLGKEGLKATWIGHASFLVETAAVGGASRGIRLLFDPVWSERTSPVKWAGPKRYTPTPCALQEIPEVDIVATSHNHYDHLDVETIRELYRAREGHIHFLCGLGGAPWFLSMGIQHDEVTELDWWQSVRIDIAGVGSLTLTCTPTQHFSGRSIWDMGKTLWCSWLVEEISSDNSPLEQSSMQASDAKREEQSLASAVKGPSRARKLFFAGDTGYRAVPLSSNISSERDHEYPHCPAFSEIGKRFGPIDLALLPIGLYSPRHMLSSVHCSPEDSIDIHMDIKSKKSIGMHWGTVRGGISMYYEDVREPPRRWREAAEKRGLVWGEHVGLLDVGETLLVD